MRLAFVDVETTGGRATRDRITEIALKVYDEGRLVNEWQSLIQPDVHIPPFIARLTGIDDHTVQEAPRFQEIVDQFESLTEGCILVAHNARFDYAFLKNEFKRLERRYHRRMLCTVKLAKTLYPQYPRHGLDALIERHNLPQVTRHRAMGDVLAMRSFYEFAREDQSLDVFDAAIAKQLRKPSLPKGLDEALVNTIPEVPGVYRFYGENRVLLYVGKSVNLYQRVMSHFSSDHSSTKEMTIAQSIVDIEWTETAGDLGAQLLELKEIKSLNPTYNRRSRAAKTLATFKLSENSDGYLIPSIQRQFEVDHLDQYFGLYRSQTAAQKALVNIAAKNELCRKLLGLESGDGPCFGYQIGSCQGACVGDEELPLYNLRMQIAFHELQLKSWPYKGLLGIQERHVTSGKSQLHLVFNWCHLATVDSEADVDAALINAKMPAFDLDTYKLLVKAVQNDDEALSLIEFGRLMPAL